MDKIGQGSFRDVFAHPDNPEKWVVKVPREGVEKHGRAMNREEVRAAELYPSLFPAVHDDNSNALIVDRADLVQNLVQFFSSIARLKQMGSVTDDWALLRELIRIRARKKPLLQIEDFGFSRRVAASISKKDPLIRQFADAVNQLDIDVTDITPDNAGVSRSTGNFVLVDASTLAGFRG